jgi:hypothetical protein
MNRLQPWHCRLPPDLGKGWELFALIYAAKAKVQNLWCTFTFCGVQLSSTLRTERLHSLVSALCDLDVVLGIA